MSPVQTSSPSDMPKYLQETQVSQEFKDLILSLRREKGWVASHLHQYQGFWHTTRQLQGVLACQKHFQSQDTDVLLVTNPKSGTTWLKSILFSLINRSVFTDPKKHPLLTTNPHVLVPFLELDLYVENRRPNISYSSSPRLFSTHLPYVSLPESVKSSACKLVYLCRSPKDAFVSHWHFANRLRPESLGENSMEEIFEKFCKGVSLCGPFWDHSLGYWNESFKRPEKVLFLSFEEMKREPVFHVRRLAEFIGCPFSEEEEAKSEVEDVLEMCSFDSLSNLEVNKIGKLPSGEDHKAFFRRGEVGDWVNYLTPQMAEKLDSIVEQNLHGSGLKF
ncbi:Flavonol sulfotransferase-like protein [Morus notabilis]|uniref:Sulfotransferase n=1 Tax=Morus notabilis TaxID=981085 RepID=W9QNQ9_9ROSA|nr:cytosolic sulfotransferase 12 [Morus notabilis]EXB44895.1 Flavonol sulfotransferase-like protein [Morus notabilis]